MLRATFKVCKCCNRQVSRTVRFCETCLPAGEYRAQVRRSGIPAQWREPTAAEIAARADRYRRTEETLRRWEAEGCLA